MEINGVRINGVSHYLCVNAPNDYTEWLNQPQTKEEEDMIEKSVAKNFAKPKECLIEKEQNNQSENWTI